MSDSNKKTMEPATLKILTKEYGEFGRIEVIDISKDSEKSYVLGLEMEFRD